jgi:hypothetical protein
MSQLGHLYLAPNFIDKKEEDKPNVIPNKRLIDIAYRIEAI